MRYSRVCRFLSLSLILVLLVLLSPVPIHAAGVITLNPSSGRIGDWIEISGSGFDADNVVYLYLSSDEAEVDDVLDDEVTAYEFLLMLSTDADGKLVASSPFFVPGALTDGSVKEDVHIGDYYVYATYVASKTIIAVAGFTVIGSEIELDPEEGAVGIEVRISGEGLRQSQGITVEYDGDEVDITSGDTETDSQGKFTGTIIIPESAFGSHTITVTDESGNNPEAEFSVKPNITLDPPSQVVGEVVMVSGTGFAKREAITLTLDGQMISTTPLLIDTDHLGSFNCSFVVPISDSLSVRRVKASSSSLDRAEAQLTVLTSVVLRPITSPDSPGHVGMELSVYGSGFIANGMVNVTYAVNDEVITMAEAKADGKGNLLVGFSVPASVAGSHVVTATDGTTSATAIFIMESHAPSVPNLLLPEVASTSPAEAYFAWEDVTDPSGVSYILQVAADANFNTILLERGGLPTSEYVVGKEERLAPAKAGVPCYWRVRAIDGASNEGDWSFPRLFFVAFPGTSLLGWVWYTLCGLGVLLLVIIGFWWWRRRARVAP